MVAGLSLGAIWWLVGDFGVVPFLLGIAAFTYAAIALSDRLVKSPPSRIATAICFASALFGALLALNVLGIVGNLTGNPESESLRNQWVITIGIGFYIACKIGDVSPDEAMGAIWPYLGALLIGLLLIAAVPALSISYL